MSGIACDRAESHPGDQVESKAPRGERRSQSTCAICTGEVVIGNYTIHRMERIGHDRKEAGLAKHMRTPGKAEVELAYLNQIEEIDTVPLNNFLFRARTASDPSTNHIMLR